MIRKGKAAKPNEFGKMVKLQKIVVEVYARRLNDADLLISRHRNAPSQTGTNRYLVAADAGFYSAKNATAAKAKGIKRVCVRNRSTKS